MDKAKLLEMVAEALEVEVAQISLDSSTENTEEWDSLGHITILSSLDEETDGKSADIPDLTQAASVNELFEILKTNGLIDA